MGRTHDKLVYAALGELAIPPSRQRPVGSGLWSCGLIEPNAWGASEIRASFWDMLQAGGERVGMMILQRPSTARTVEAGCGGAPSASRGGSSV